MLFPFPVIPIIKVADKFGTSHDFGEKSLNDMILVSPLVIWQEKNLAQIATVRAPQDFFFSSNHKKCY